MPLITIRRKADVVVLQIVLDLAPILIKAVVDEFLVEVAEVEVHFHEVGQHDFNCPPIAISIDTGKGRNDVRVADKQRIGLAIADKARRSGLLKPEWMLPNGSHVWLRICDSFFVPIGEPEHAR